ncbi:MAG TPA: DNA-binding protein [Clostridiales bacterium]|nr:DNA-binding protein [Clostridiales bacterium]
MEKQNLIAIIGDLINSKSIENRFEVQEKLKGILDVANLQYKEYIVSKWTITLGDEFQVLIKPNSKLFEMLDFISYKMYPYEIRYGIGLGAIKTKINYENSIGADGPAYWNARAAIEFIHDNNNYGTSKTAFISGDKSDEVINNLLAYTDWMKERWTDSQRAILHHLIDANMYDEKFEQKKLAEILDISRSAMSRRVKSSGIKLYLSSKNSLARCIKNMGGF